MRLVLIGCEYAGKMTLAGEISKWMIQRMGLPLVRWHDHFVVPRVDGHTVVKAESENDIIAPGKTAADLNTEEDEKQIMALRPSVLEQLQRHMIWRHLDPSMYTDDDYLVVNWYYADAVYAPLYYGYGEPGTFADRRQRARAWDAEVIKRAPDTILVLVKASAEVIRQRMRQSPRPRCILKEQDVELVLGGFEEEYNNLLILRRFTLDTTSTSASETFQKFLRQMWPYLSPVDRLRLVSRPDTSIIP